MRKLTKERAIRTPKIWSIKDADNFLRYVKYLSDIGESLKYTIEIDGIKYASVPEMGLNGKIISGGKITYISEELLLKDGGIKSIGISCTGNK